MREALGYIRAGVADTNSQGAVCVGIRDKPLAFDFDDELDESGTGLVGYIGFPGEAWR